MKTRAVLPGQDDESQRAQRKYFPKTERSPVHLINEPGQRAKCEYPVQIQKVPEPSNDKAKLKVGDLSSNDI
jgi:hypothetical protein